MCTRCPLLPHYFHHINSEILVDQTWGHERKPQLLPPLTAPSSSFRSSFSSGSSHKKTKNKTREAPVWLLHIKGRRLPPRIPLEENNVALILQKVKCQLISPIPLVHNFFFAKDSFSPLITRRFFFCLLNPLIFFLKNFHRLSSMRWTFPIVKKKPFMKIGSSDDDNYEVTRLSQFSVV